MFDGTLQPDWTEVAEHLVKRAREINRGIDVDRLEARQEYRQQMLPSIVATLVLGEIAAALTHGLRGAIDQAKADLRRARGED